tara:strand:- start:89 stop:373 length:285 start_codon:yes stop_codon:yes gene_type:complete
MKIHTNKHMGRNKLIDRFSEQVGDRSMAIKILQKRGMIIPGTENLTEKGMRRDSMTAEERAIDRAVTSSGRHKSEFVYDPKTNKARLDQRKIWK